MYFVIRQRQYFNQLAKPLCPDPLMCLIQAINISPDDPELYASRAQSYIKEESFLEAVQDANRAAELSPQLAKAHLRKGYASIQIEVQGSIACSHLSLEVTHPSSCWQGGTVQP